MSFSIKLITSSFIFFYFMVSSKDRDPEKADRIIDWDHAIKGKTEIYFSDFIRMNDLETDSFIFSYSQQMGYPLFGTMFKIDVSETRKFPPQMTKKELRKAFIELFSSVSYSFESMQNTFPYSLSQGSSESSFSLEDLRGNLVSLYLSINDVNLEEFQNLFQNYYISGFDHHVMDKSNITRSHIWEPVTADFRIKNSSLDLFLDELNSYQNEENPISIRVESKTSFLTEQIKESNDLKDARNDLP